MHDHAGGHAHEPGTVLVVATLLGSVGDIASGIVILATGWNAADAVASDIIAILILVSSFGLIREAVDVLMEPVPRHIDMDELRKALEEESATGDPILADMSDRLAERFGTHHVTIQLEVRNRRHAEPTH